MNPDVTQLVEWIQKTVPGLIRSGENWKVVLHGRNDGNVNAIVETNSQIMNTKRQRLDERNGSVRQVRQAV